MKPTPLPSSEAHLWFVDPDSVTPDLDNRYLALLSAAEYARYQRFRVPQAAREFLIGRALMRSILGAYLGIAPEAVKLQLGPHGKPELAESTSKIAASLAHSNGMVTCVAARDCELGVDVEDIDRPVQALELAERFFQSWEFAELSALSPAERSLRFFQYWTLKEACLKALGTGLTRPLDQFCFSFSADGTPSLLGSEARDTWQLAQLVLSERHMAAVAIKQRTMAVTRRLVVRCCVPLKAAETTRVVSFPPKPE